MKRREFLASTSLAALSVLTHAENSGQMKYRRLGRTNLKVSEIGLGGSPAPPEAVFRMAVERGVNYVDTSSTYMNGNGEILIGKMKKEFKDRLIVATKFHPGRKGYPRNTWEPEFEGSLKRLKVECVDILMIHGAYSDDIVHDEYVLSLFEKFKKQGKIRFTGISCHRNAVKTLTPGIKGGHYDMVTIGYNAFTDKSIKKGQQYSDYLSRSGIEGLIDLADKHQVGIIAMKSMAGGGFQDLSKYKKAGVSLPQVKLKWVLSNPKITGVITEIPTFDILDENLGAVGKPMTASEKIALQNHVEARSQTYCRMCGECIPGCRAGIPIPDVLRCAVYYHQPGKMKMSRSMLRDLNLSDCKECGQCEKTCPFGLSVKELVRQADHILG